MAKPKIHKISDIDEYINKLQEQADTDITRLFAIRLREIKKDLAEMFAKYERDTPQATWTEFNKYNRLNKELDVIAEGMKGDYRAIAKTIKDARYNSYLNAYMASMYVYERFSGNTLSFKVPNATKIETMLDNVLDQIKLIPTLWRHREDAIRKVKTIIGQGIMSGEGYSEIAKKLKQTMGVSKGMAQRVARTETGRAQSQASLDSAKVMDSQVGGMRKQWLATKDSRTRHTHRKLDGKSVPMDSVFKSNGCIAQAPKLFVGVNSAGENINCRCTMLYTVDDEIPEVMRTKDDGVTKFQSFDEWWRNKIK